MFHVSPIPLSQTECTDVTLDPTQWTDVCIQLINDTEPTSHISYQKFQSSPKLNFQNILNYMGVYDPFWLVYKKI